MLFSSFQFLFVFLPVFMLAYFLVPATRWRNYLILVFSLAFYVWGEKGYVALLLLSIVSTWGFGLMLGRAHAPATRKRVLALGIICNLLILFYCKYLVFFVDTLIALVSEAGISPPFRQLAPTHLPLGVSFFVFQAISYLIDVYRGDVRCQKNLLLFGMYKSNFPQLIAGPIVRYAQISHQIHDRPSNYDQFSAGAWRFLIGLSQKALLANPCGTVADQVFSAPVGSFGAAVAWVGTVAYALQIYFDFCGYSNMAIGLGKTMGFTFPENFNHPYEATSVSDFWRRWHMSLSTWFRDYLYIPLGGNRGGPARTYFNLLVVFLLCGLWHGAAWTFVAWGLYHGIFLCFERTAAGMWTLATLTGTFGRVYAMFAVLLGWVLFRATSLTHAATIASTLFGFPPEPGKLTQGTAVPLSLYDVLGYEPMTAILVGTFIGLGLHRPLMVAGSRLLAAGGLSVQMREIGKATAMLSTFTLSLAYIAGSTFNPFLYFRF